jgi:hypothetical protein
MPSLALSAKDAAARVADFRDSVNSMHYEPDSLPEIDELSEKMSVFVFNVGPWSYSVQQGSLGTFYIPACEDGQPYSRPLKIKGINAEPYPEGDGKMKTLKPERGSDIAKAVLGIGPFRQPQHALTLRGCFISATETPSATNLKTANEHLMTYYRNLVAEADRGYQQGPTALARVLDGSDGRHFLAARKIGRTESQSPWLGNSTQQVDRAECSNCGTPHKPGIAECPSCGNILDMEKYKTKLKRQAEAQSAIEKK